MKKVFFLLALVCATLLAFGQPTDSEIYRVISANRSVNLVENGVVNPDLIYPGQVLSYVFEDGSSMNTEVGPGDTQWSIVTWVLGLEKTHGMVVPPADTATSVVDSVPVTTLPTSIFTSPEFPSWLWFLVVVVGVLFLVWLFNHLEINRRERRYANPVTSGPAQVSGGVNDRRAHQRMQEIASDRYPGAYVKIHNVRRGRLSGPAMVHYASGAPKERILDDIFAYAGEVDINGIRQTIYFLQGCGNDVRQGNFMTGENLVFTPDAEIASDGASVPVVAPVSDVPTGEAKKEETAEDFSSEYHRQVTQTLGIVSEFMKGNDPKHKVSITVEPNKLNLVIDTKNVTSVTDTRPEK